MYRAIGFSVLLIALLAPEPHFCVELRRDDEVRFINTISFVLLCDNNEIWLIFAYTYIVSTARAAEGSATHARGVRSQDWRNRW